MWIKFGVLIFISLIKHQFWAYGSQDMSQNTLFFALFGQKLDGPTTLTLYGYIYKVYWRFVSTFYGFRTSKNVIFLFRHPFWVPALTWNISCFRTLPKKLFVQTDKGKHRECRKIIIWLSLILVLFSFLTKLFFVHVSILKVFGLFVFWDLSSGFNFFPFKFGMYVPYKTGLWRIVYGFWAGAST